MPILSTDIVYKYSVQTGSAGDSTVGTAAGSLGKYVSTTPIADATLNALFDNVSGDENAAGDVEYRCIFVHNNHASLPLKGTVVWLASEVVGGANITIATDNIGVTAKDSASPQAASVDDEDTAPVGVSSFSAPTTKSGGLLLGDIPAGSVVPVWVKRTATNSAALSNDGMTLRVEGDTD